MKPFTKSIIFKPGIEFKIETIAVWFFPFPFPFIDYQNYYIRKEFSIGFAFVKWALGVKLIIPTSRDIEEEDPDIRRIPFFGETGYVEDEDYDYYDFPDFGQF